MARSSISAGLLLCKHPQLQSGVPDRLRGHPSPDGWEFLLAHPGGPFFKNKDDGVWTLPKGLAELGEPLLAAACREFHEETGFAVPESGHFSLGWVVQGSGKQVHAWGFVGDCDPAALVSNTFEMEWPPRSGKKVQLPEIDRVAFFTFAQAEKKLLAAQVPFLSRALEALQSLQQ